MAVRFMFTPAYPNLPNSVQVVYDAEHPDVEPGELKFFGSFPDRETARMTCLALNGATDTPREAT